MIEILIIPGIEDIDERKKYNRYNPWMIISLVSQRGKLNFDSVKNFLSFESVVYLSVSVFVFNTVNSLPVYLIFNYPNLYSYTAFV